MCISNNKIEKLSEIWIRWNLKAISGDKAMSEIKEVFDLEIQNEIEKYCDKK